MRPRPLKLLVGVSLAALVALVVVIAVSVSPAAATAPSPAVCPTHSLTAVAPNSWAPARRELLPTGALALRLCRFAGFAGTQPPKLAGSREVTSAAAIAQLTHDLDALPPFPKVALPCPLDNGSQVDVLAAFPGGHRVTVSYDSTGCQRVTNGDVVKIANGYRDAALAARLRRELTAGS
jgi:hypothetical protein